MSNIENQENEGYKTAFKSTSIYGGVQVVTIIISILRSKLTALWLGTTGFGLLSVFNSTITLVSTTSNLGLSSSAVRDISKSNMAKNQLVLCKTVTAISRCVILTGLVGALFMFLFSSKISFWTFGNLDYAYAYMFLAVVVLINNVYSGHYAVLQGLRKIKSMAVAKILGAVIGLLIIIPCYYIGGEKGIVPSIILSSISALIISKFFTSQLDLQRVKQTIRESFIIGKSTITLGIMMMATSFSASLVELIIKVFITRYGGLEEVGLYQAGWAINTQYLGLVFTAMATDYFPRLTQQFQSKNQRIVNNTINQQSEIALLILAPLICGMVVFLPIVISILYTSEFSLVVPMTRLLLIGSLIKAGSWAVSFLFLAAGDGKVYLLNEVGIKLFNLPLYLACYYFGGLLWVGYGFVLNYSVYFIWVTFVANKKYAFVHSRLFSKILVINITLCVLSCLSVSVILNIYLKYSLSIVVLLVSITYSFIELNKRIGLESIINKIFTKNKKK